MGYTDIISRTDLDAGTMIPPEISKEVIKDAPKSSVVLSNARRVPMSAKVRTQPVLNSFPIAYWVNGDVGLKQTTKQQWGNLSMTAEELAAIVVIPDSLVDDANIPLWPEVQPYLVEAIGLKVDQAALFGLDKPASWPAGIVPSAIAAGNTVEYGAGSDLAQDVALLGERLAVQGYPIGTFVSQPGLEWRLRQLRSQDGVPIYGQPLAQGQPSTLFGLPLNPVDNGAWESESALLAAVDWRKFVVGIRQDITWKWFSEGVISDDDGKVVVNLMQQDSKALAYSTRSEPVNLQPDIPKSFRDASDLVFRSGGSSAKPNKPTCAYAWEPFPPPKSAVPSAPPSTTATPMNSASPSSKKSWSAMATRCRCRCRVVRRRCW